MRTAFATVIIGLCGVLSAGRTARAGATAPESGALSVLPDPGPKPKLDPRDYDAYMKEGTSVITGRMELPDTFGRNLTCIGEDVLLYPSTAYTRWIVQTWAREIDGGTEAIGLDEPDDSRTGIGTPAYLRAMRDDPPTAIRFGHCDQSNNIYIGHIPAGRYLLVTQLNRQVSADFHHEYGQVIVQTPNGEYPENYGTRTTGGFRYDDGYVVTFNGELEVRAGQQYSIANGSIRAVAHYHPRKE
ncbi:MAG: hypothetical protein IAI50_10460 [Candidatus Eremiobacteraeota bacterium]|nr:hypothetical protein [Candidatus Eremiobacteraeota bacterium]